jgi:uncharacterized protein with FMN-binding domain
MPKRGAFALLLTTGALVLLLSFKTPAEVPAAATGAVAAAVPSPAPAIVEPTPAPVAAEPPVGAVPPTTTQAPAAPEATTAPVAPAVPNPTAAAGAAYADGTVTGSPVQIRWGTVQVQVTISGGAITDVTALQLPTGDRHSAQISQRAETELRSSALQAQSAQITVLSGATYTSLAYARSLQSALDQARA